MFVCVYASSYLSVCLSGLKPGADAGGRHGSLSPELQVMSQLQGTDFETALREAGMYTLTITCVTPNTQ